MRSPPHCRVCCQGCCISPPLECLPAFPLLPPPSCHLVGREPSYPLLLVEFQSVCQTVPWSPHHIVCCQLSGSSFIVGFSKGCPQRLEPSYQQVCRHAYQPILSANMCFSAAPSTSTNASQIDLASVSGRVSASVSKEASPSTSHIVSQSADASVSHHVYQCLGPHIS